MSVNCEYCNQPFSRLHGLKRHQGMGPGRPLSCPVMDPNLQKKMISDYPHLLKEYNGNGDPTKITARIHKKLPWKCSTCEHEWTSRGSVRARLGCGCPACSGRLHSDGRNSMANTHPELAKEYQGDATKIIAGTHKILEWKCSTCEHEWPAPAKSRSSLKYGCPFCSGRSVHIDGRNSMANTHPELAIEYQGDATLIIAGTNRKLDWKCSECEHEWITTGDKRTHRGQGCPVCAEYGFDQSKPACVYQIRFVTEDHGLFYKCGITNNKPEIRRTQIRTSYKNAYTTPKEVTIVNVVNFDLGSAALKFENKLKDSEHKLKNHFVRPFSGSTETYNTGVLAYWDELKAETLQDQRV